MTISEDKIIVNEEQKIFLHDFTLFELITHILEDQQEGNLDLFKIDILLFILQICQFKKEKLGENYRKELQFLMSSREYCSDFGWNRISYLIKKIRIELKFDYLINGTLAVINGRTITNERLYLLPIRN